MSKQNEIEYIHAANKECDRLQAEINVLKKALERILNYSSTREQTDKYYHIVLDVRAIARRALNGESEK